MRSEDFHQDRPDQEVEEDLARHGWLIMAAQPKLPMEEKHQRQSARDEKEVVEVRMQEVDLKVWFENPAVEPVKHAAYETQEITEIPERNHIKARMKRPAVAARAIFRIKSMPHGTEGEADRARSLSRS